MDTLRQDIRHALRSLRVNPGFALVAVLTLALGIGANTAIFSVVQAILLRPLPYPQPERLVRVYATNANTRTGPFSGPDYLDLARASRSFTAVGAMVGTSFTLTGSGEPERLQGEVVSASYFDVMGVPPLLGRTFAPATTAAAGARQVVLSWEAWRTRFGGERAILGRSLRLNGEAYEVVGVMPHGFQGLQWGTRIWTLARGDVPDAPPYGDVHDIEHNRGARYLDLLARLRPGVSLQSAAAELRGLGTHLATAYPGTDDGLILRVRDWHEDLVGDTRRPLTLLLSAVGLVLLIACANIANLLLTRGAGRRREVVIRCALGASRRRVARQLLTENFVLAALGGAAGVALGYAVLGPIRAALPVFAGPGVDMSRVAIDGRVLLFALGVSVMAGLLAGVVPALSVSRTPLGEGLRQGGRGLTEGGARERLRAAFVVAQVALSLMLVVGAALLLRSYARLTATDPGFDRTRVAAIALPLPATRYRGAQVGRFYQQVLERIEALPGVQAAGAVFDVPLTGKASSGAFVVEGRPAPKPGQEQDIGIDWATGGAFRALRIPLRAGRVFDQHDAADTPPVVVINQTMAKGFWPGENPVGRRVKLATDPADTTSPWMTVVGVVGDVRPAALDVPPRPEMYLPLTQNAWSWMTLLVRTTTPDPSSLTPAVRRVVAELDPELPLGDVGTLEAVVENSVAQPRFRTMLLTVFALLALALAAIGIYGVVSFGVTQRRPEIGVRLALGATPGDVRRLVVGRGLRPVLIGLGLGLAGALAAARVLRGLLYGVTAWDPLTFLAVTLLLTLVALAASWLPARRAAAIDPMLSLRME